MYDAVKSARSYARTLRLDSSSLTIVVLTGASQEITPEAIHEVMMPTTTAMARKMGKRSSPPILHTVRFQ
jgi:hypothetical protein